LSCGFSDRRQANCLVEGAGQRNHEDDQRQQEDPAIRAYYESIAQPDLRYGDGVEKLSASEAIGKYKPEVALASWVTHHYNSLRQDAGGSETGID